MLDPAGALACPDGPDAKDFERWYKQHHARLRAFCTRLTGDQATAEDIAQETLLRAWARRADFERNGDIRSWLYTVARNLSIEALRARAKVVSTGEVPEHPDSEADPVIPIERAEERRQVRSALSQMTPRHREMLVARDVNGVAYEELARRLGVTEDTARAVLFRARRRLRERFLAASRAMGVGGVAIKARVFGAARRASDHTVAFQNLSGALAQVGAGLGAAAIMALAPHGSLPVLQRRHLPVPATLTVQATRASLSVAVSKPAPRVRAKQAKSSKPVTIQLNHKSGGGTDARIRNPVSGDSEHAWVHVWRETGQGDSEVLDTLDQTCESNEAVCTTVDHLPGTVPQG